ncbi:MAG TPA: IS200/IS605 family transposase [Capsulimonadaceae bacterium]|nr:IS200/IS605 family transposase [Capsulimonadaceae bacterium]
MLTGQIEPEAYAIVRSRCKAMKAELYAIGGVADHVHLLVSVPTTVSIANFMHDIKGVSSNMLNERFGSPKWAFKWQIGYGFNTVCPTHVAVTQRYIENQKQHHADRTLWPGSEPSD